MSDTLAVRHRARDRASREALAGLHPVLVDHSEAVELEILRVVVIAERKGVVAVEPS